VLASYRELRPGGTAVADGTGRYPALAVIGAPLVAGYTPTV